MIERYDSDKLCLCWGEEGICVLVCIKECITYKSAYFNTICMFEFKNNFRIADGLCYQEVDRNKEFIYTVES